MNWIDFKKERPKEEPDPERELIIKCVYEGKIYHKIMRALYAINVATDPAATHWSEIEQTTKPREEAVNLLRVGFVKELEYLINKHSMENGSNTPDFILADYLMDCLETFNKTTSWRTKWYAPTKSECVQTAAPEPPPKPDDKCFMLEEALKRVLIAHGSYGDGGNLDKAVRKICHDALNKEPTEEEISQFMKEYDEGKYPLSVEGNEALRKAGEKLMAHIEINDPPPKPDPFGEAFDDNEARIIHEAYMHGKPTPPPKPDPFEEWWIDPDRALNEDFNTQKEVAYVSFKAGWDAAIKWKEGKR